MDVQTVAKMHRPSGMPFRCNKIGHVALYVKDPFASAKFYTEVTAGRRSPSLNKALEDQAAMVRAATVKVLGRSSDAAAVAKITRALKD